MKKIFSKGLFMLAAGLLTVSCADYNVTDDFKADPDPSVVEPYKDLGPVKSYIDRDKYPNMTLGATLKVAEFNKQELAHAAAVTNFDNLAFGNTLMSGKIVSDKGVMNFLDMKDLLDHVEEIGGEVFGSPLFANADQADGWLSMLTSPIEIEVEYVEGKVVNYKDSTEFHGTTVGGDAKKNGIVSFEGENVLKIGTSQKVCIIEGFEVDSLATYTTTFWARPAKSTQASYTVVFSGDTIQGNGAGGKWTLPENKWTKVVVEAKARPGVTQGYLRIQNTKSSDIYIQKAQIGYYPDNHRPQTEKEKTDTINYAINAWCDGVMKINEGRITSFDLIDEPIDVKSELMDGIYDLKHSTDKIYWQDVLGSENYGSAVAKAARDAYEEYGNGPSELKFFISESNLDDPVKFNSLIYWINKWDANGANIDGINAKVSLVYSENAETVKQTEESFDQLLDNLKNTGKLVRISNFDIKYQDASGANVTAKDITEVQRQALADFYGKIIKKYMTVIPNDKQAGICKGNIVDTNDPVGLWSKDTKSNDWVRNATYKAFCDVLSGK